MLTSSRAVVLSAMLALMIGGLAACDKKEVAADEKGPAERAGQQVDQAASRASEELNKVAEKTGQGLQELGKKLQNEAQEAQKKE